MIRKCIKPALGSAVAIALFSTFAVAVEEKSALLYECMPAMGSYPIGMDFLGGVVDGRPNVTELVFHLNRQARTVKASSKIITISGRGNWDGDWLEVSFRASENQRPVTFIIAYPERVTGPHFHGGSILDFPGVTPDTKISGNGFENISLGDGLITGQNCYKR